MLLNEGIKSTDRPTSHASSRLRLIISSGQVSGDKIFDGKDICGFDSTSCQINRPLQFAISVLLEVSPI